MKTPYRLIARATAALLTLQLSGAAAVAVAQAPPPLRKLPQHPEGGNGMKDLMDGPHQALAMAYRDNVATFARAVQRQATLAKTVDLDLARPAVLEMRRSLG